MKNLKMKRLGIITCFFSVLLPGFGMEPVKIPPKEKFYLILLAGQSNMAGRGKIQPEDKIPYPRVLMLDKQGDWIPAVAPIHFDKPEAGIGPGDHFAKLLAASDPSITIGVIPTACGGSSIKQWQPGAYWKQTQSYPYDDAVARMRKALNDGTLKAILWHQGESDCHPENVDGYAERLTALIKDFRQKFNAAKIPVLIGQLSQFSGQKWNDERRKIDQAQRKVVSISQPAAFVTSEGLTSNPDKIHFDRASQFKFGKRYYEAYLKLVSTRKNTSVISK